MASSLENVDTFLVLDDRLAVSDKIAYGVYKGAASNNVQKFPATAQSPSQLIFNVQVPQHSL